ncbi:MAG: GntR family transcriptional regulator [Thermoleophilia bacterium]
MSRSRERILPAQLEGRVYDRLREEILSGAIGRGEQLVEARLAAEFGISKTPVREALIRLQRDGLVEIEPYRGARVVRPSARDVREILELRRLLECHIARDLAARRPADVISAMALSIAESREALERGDAEELAESLTRFSDVLAAACENNRLEKVLDELRSVLLLIGNTTLGVADRESRSIEQHERILAAVRSGDEDDAERATVEHIRSIELDFTAEAERPNADP